MGSCPYSFLARWTVLLFALTLSSTTSFGQNVAGFILGKVQNFRQTSPAAPVVDSAQPFQFGALITMGTATINSATLNFTGTSNPRTFTAAGNGDFSILDTFTTQAQMDAAYLNGNFTVNINTSAGAFSRTIFLFPFSYPTTARLTVPADNWQNNAIVLDPAMDYTFTWGAFSNAQAADVIELVIRNSGVNLSPFPATQTSYTLPAGSLQPNTDYTCDLAFVRVAGAAAGDANIGPGYATLVKDTGFMIHTPAQATPTPTPTATPTPVPTVNISGNVAYCPGSPRPMQNVTLNLTGDTTTSTLSDGSGNYQFLSLASGGTYTVTPTKGDLPAGLGTTGINTADAQLVQKHFQSGGTLLTGCALAAARTNANNLGDPNTSDALFIQQFFLFSPNPLPTSNRAGQWRFSPANRTYPGVNSDQTGQNYDAFALGDVNGDLTMPAGPSDLPTMPMSVSVPVAVTKVALPNVDTSLSDFVAAVTTSNIAAGDKLVAFQGDFTFDSRVVTFQSTPVQAAGLTASGNWALAANVLGTGTLKTLRVSCFALDANSVLSGEGPLFELRMTRVRSKPGASTQLIWAAAPNNFMFLDDNVQWRSAPSTQPGSVTVRPATGRR